jgi:galactonate dehydratase
MEIRDFEIYAVPPRWVFLKITTSTGVVGWGEPLIEGRARAVKNTVAELLENYLIGTDPLRIEEHWQTMYRGGFHRGGPILMSAIAGIDQALWDIKGKHYGIPVFELLGGQCRDRIRVYKWVGGNRPAALANEANRLVDAGYTALKMDGMEELYHIDTQQKVDEIASRVRSVREEVGPEIDISVDFHGRVSKPMAKRLTAELEEYSPMFIEEPVLPMNNEHLPEVASHSTVPIATGERLYSRWDFKQILTDGAVDVVQPDVSHAGGISEVVKISNMAEAHGVTVSPNCHLGPIALAASLQIGASIPNLLVQENELDIGTETGSLAEEYLSDPNTFDFDDGFIGIIDSPGLGIGIDEETVSERSRIDFDWDNPRWRHADGSIAEW